MKINPIQMSFTGKYALPARVNRGDYSCATHKSILEDGLHKAHEKLAKIATNQKDVNAKLGAARRNSLGGSETIEFVIPANKDDKAKKILKRYMDNNNMYYSVLA